MKAAVFVLILAGQLVVFAAGQTNFEEVAFGRLLAAPEEYGSRFVSYSATFRRLITNFQPYVEASGFKPAKYLALEIGDAQVPVLMKKTTANLQLVEGLKPGSTVRVQGRVREFKVKSKYSAAPRFYVEMKTLEVIFEPQQTQEQRRTPRESTPDQ